jgi:CRISPR-associated protein Cas1
LTNQIDVLKINCRSQEKIKKIYQYIDEIHDGDVSNREGHAAKVYFNELFGKDFTRDDDCLTNSALNYGYTVIRSAMSRTVVSKGLHPSISLFHHNMYDAYALADDLMEPFRPIVDNFVISNIKDWDYFGRDQKLALINLLNTIISFNGKEQYLTNAMSMYVDSIITSFQKNNVNLINFPYADILKYYEL